jgi:cytochrome c oxidase assembly protein subunit 11
MSSQNHTKVVKRLVLLVVGMFGFGFAMVPLYDVFCDITGLNGKTSNTSAELAKVIDVNRDVTVQFITQNGAGMPWLFEPEINQIVVNPGIMTTVNFRATNLSSNDIVGQAIPSVAPGLAANHFNKTECFCFQEQMLKGGETVNMPVTFYVNAELPKDIKEVTLSYTLYNVTDKVAEVN